MFAKTQTTVSMILGVALVAATFAAPAFAGEASLSHNERAAQSAIVGAAANDAPVSVDASAATLARNEALAQRAIVDVSTSGSTYGDAIGAATLTQNELAAQRSIVDTHAADASARYEGAAKARVASTRSPSTP